MGKVKRDLHYYNAYGHQTLLGCDIQEGVRLIKSHNPKILHQIKGHTAQKMKFSIYWRNL